MVYALLSNQLMILRSSSNNNLNRDANTTSILMFFGIKIGLTFQSVLLRSTCKTVW